MQTVEAKRERAARSKLTAEGYRLNKAPSRHWTRKQFGVGYQILRGNQVVAGCGQREYEMDLEGVEDFVSGLVNDRIGPESDTLRNAFTFAAQWRRGKFKQWKDARCEDAASILDHLVVTVDQVDDKLMQVHNELFDHYTAHDEQGEMLRAVGIYYFPKDATEFVKDFIAACTAGQ